jgi:Na+-transporting methylmalonyl-CoA/oxaloacetate decarboxylase gamma subunit
MMRTILTLLGTFAVIVYSLLGATLMNDWAVVAASTRPLEMTIAAMDAAGQNYTTIPGIVFAGLGILLALAWGVMTIVRRTVLSNWAAVSLWAGIVALGAPAYFYLSFDNLNSVGDTYLDWNSKAEVAAEAPLYMASGVAFIVLFAMVVFAMSKATAREKPSPTT